MKTRGLPGMLAPGGDVPRVQVDMLLDRGKHVGNLEGPLGRITRPLTGRTVLIVEDDFLVGHDLRAFLEEAGATILGPIDDIARACGVARDQEIDGAVLDVHVWDDTAAPVAVELTARQVPFIVVSGYDPEDVPPAMRGATYLSKPIRRLELVTVAAAMFSRGDRRLGRPIPGRVN